MIWKAALRSVFDLVLCIVVAGLLSYMFSSLKMGTVFNKSQFMDGLVTYSSSLSIAIILSRIGILHDYKRATLDLLLTVILATGVSIVAWGLTDSTVILFGYVGLDNLMMTLSIVLNLYLTGKIVSLLRADMSGR